MKMSNSIASFVLLLILISTNCLCSAQQCRPSGRIMGKKPPPGECNKENDSDCCVQGKAYTTYKCSPAVSRHTKAELTLNSFEKGGDGGGDKHELDEVLRRQIETKNRCLNQRKM